MKGDQCPVEAVQDILVKWHNVLLSFAIGEANAAIRRCPGNGLWASKKLSATLRPRTLASGVKAISQVLNPDKITNAPKAVCTWEDKMAKLSAEYCEVISAKMKVAVLYRPPRQSSGQMCSELGRRQRIRSGGDLWQSQRGSKELCEVQT